MAAKSNRTGKCKLTGITGIFVDSHIIPKAVTRPEIPGAPLIQQGSGRKPVRRWSSWYDKELVTIDGEAILSEYDDWAIRELRKHRLIWSGWGNSDVLSREHFSPFVGSPWGIRKVSGIDTTKLRTFFLSVLWRSAASSLMEFEQVRIPEENLEKLRLMVKNRTAEPLEPVRKFLESSESLVIL